MERGGIRDRSTNIASFLPGFRFAPSRLQMIFCNIRVRSQQIEGNSLQCFQLLLADVRAFVFLETENKKPSASFVRCHQCACTSSFTRPGSATRFSAIPPLRSASISPVSISETALESAALVRSVLRIHREMTIIEAAPRLPFASLLSHKLPLKFTP